MNRASALLALAGVLLAGCSSGPSAAAKASASASKAAAYDQIFLTGVASVWSPVDDPAAHIKIGHDVCHLFDVGDTYAQVQAVEELSSFALHMSSAEEITSTQAGTLIGSATAVYCPRHADLLP